MNSDKSTKVDGIKKSKLTVYLHHLVKIIFFVYLSFVALDCIALVSAIFNPKENLAWLGESSTMFELSPLDSAPVYTASSSDPEAMVDMKLMVFFKYKTGDRLYNFLFLLVFSLWHGFFLVAFNQLRLLLSKFTVGNPFVNESTRRIRLMGYCLIGGELVRNIGAWFWYFYLLRTISVHGARIKAIDFWMFIDEFNLEVFFAGFIILVIAEVFKVGIRLKEEQELTI